MCFVKLQVFLASLVLPSLASPAGHGQDRVQYPPEGHVRTWKRGSKLVNSAPIRLSIALSAPPQQLEEAERLLERISDPDSPHFGQHLSPRDANELLSPPQNTVDNVLRWLVDSGIPRTAIKASSSRAVLSIITTAEDGEQLLQTSFHQYLKGRSVEISSSAYRVPRHLSPSIDFISVSIPSPPKKRRSPPQPERSGPPISKRPGVTLQPTQVNCLEYMTPACLRLLYNIPPPDCHPTHPNSTLGIYAQSWSTHLDADLDAFYTQFHPDLVGTRPHLMDIDGGYRQYDQQGLHWNLENNVDIQYATSIAFPHPVTVIQVGSRTQVGNTNLMLAAFDADYCASGGIEPVYDMKPPDPINNPDDRADCGTVDPPKVISISYAWNEAEFSARYLRRQCREYLKLGLRGVTVLAASGDWGVADQLHKCLNPDTNLPTPPHTPGLSSPTFPASCPWVTVIGGTQLAPNTSTWNPSSPSFPPETAMSSGHPHLSTSGAGFSNIFPRPAYQSPHVASYLTTHNPSHLPAGFFNHSGRAYPDISLLSLNYLAHSNGALRRASGTSVAAPVVAGMLARVNDGRLRRGKGTVGFLNGILYSKRGAEFLRDVTSGWNVGCLGNETAKVFEAGEGWDAVTGLGTVDFGGLWRVLVEELP
ncbi:alkaline serine protease [Podospora conica]|nr:alkaline serine protease [Schizothecium conicum]